MMEGMDAVLAKVKKLLKLAEGNANVEESASAAAKAQELIDKYKLSLTDLEAREVEAEPISVDHTLRQGKHMIWWQLKLACGVALANSCKAYSQDTVLPNGKKYSNNIKLIGSKSDAMIVAYLYGYLVKEIDRRAKLAVSKLELDGEHWGVSPRSYGNSFRIGCVDAINARLTEQKRQLHKDHVGSTALMRIDNQLAKVDAVAKQLLGAKQVSGGGQTQLDGYMQGKREGATIPMHKGLGGSNAGAIGAGRKLLG